MNRRHLILALGTTAALPMLAACGGPKPPPPTVVTMHLRATPGANQDEAGHAKPIRVRVLRLTNTQAIQQADFFSLDQDPQQALGQELIGFDDFLLSPGDEQPYQKEFEPDARYVAVVGAYFLIDRAAWRAWAPVPPNVTSSYEAVLGPLAVQLQESSA